MMCQTKNIVHCCVVQSTEAPLARHPDFKDVGLFLKEARMSSGKKIGRRKIYIVGEVVAVSIYNLRASQLM